MISDDDILEVMEIYGGSFVRQLAILYRLGDLENRYKLSEAFRHYFDEYKEVARLKYEREHQT